MSGVSRLWRRRVGLEGRFLFRAVNYVSSRFKAERCNVRSDATVAAGPHPSRVQHCLGSRGRRGR